MPQVHDIWHWQEPETTWNGIGIYHVTLTMPSREPLLGKLIIPENDPKQAHIERGVRGCCGGLYMESSETSSRGSRDQF